MLGDGGRPGTEGVRNRFSRTFSLYDDPDTQSQVLRFIFGRTGTSVYFLNQGRFQRKKMGKCENFSISHQPPSPQFGNSMFLKRKKNNGLFCIWGPLGTFLFFTFFFSHFFGGIMVDRKGNGWPPPPRRENSHFIPFSLTFLQNEHSGTQNKINLKWSNWSDNTSPLL